MFARSLRGAVCAVALLSTAAQAQQASPPQLPDESAPVATAPVRLLADFGFSGLRVPAPPPTLGPKATVSVNFLPAGAGSFGDTCIAWPTQARAAFQYAAGIWAAQVGGSVPININACWANNMESGVLGHAGAMSLRRNFSGAPQANTWYPAALANTLAGNDGNTSQAEIYAGFNSIFSWYLGTDANPPATQHDFVTVVLHEIGHGLGFSGSMNVSSGTGRWGNLSSPYIYDRFTENAAGQALIDTLAFPNPSVALATQLQSNAVFFDAPHSKAANGGLRVPLYAPATWNGGSSYSHLAESFNGTPHALMTFSLSRGEAIHDPGPLVRAVLRDLGWPLAEAGAFALAVTRNGTGAGTVSSVPSGIHCGVSCAANFDSGTLVTLTASAGANSVFTGWAGACGGSSSTCTVPMAAAQAVTATFNLASRVLSVQKAGDGAGTVTSSPSGIDCNAACATGFPHGTSVTLTATPANGSTFTGWSGACSGTGSCVVAMTAAASVTANFTLRSFPVSVTRSGTGAGTVASVPVGIDCGSACSMSLVFGAHVVLTATPAAGSSFTGWSGGCSGTGTCSVTVSSATQVTASFAQVPANAQLTLERASIDFGGQSLRTTAPAQAVKITNTGGSPLSVGSVTAPAPFGASHDCGTLAPGASCSAQVAFLPTVEGHHAAQLGIESTGGAGTVSLAGIGERSLVTHYYRSILRRAPEAGGKAFWESEALRVQAMGIDVNEAWFALAASFYGSAEYAAFNRNPTEFVRDLYNTFFNRPADAAGLAFWTGEIAAGVPREVVLVTFMFSSEFASFSQAIFGAVASRPESVTVSDFYRGLLGRLPDSAGFTYWLGEFRRAQCSAESAVAAQAQAISSAYANSPENIARNRSAAQYVADLYNAFLRRGGEREGVQFWIGQLEKGTMSRDAVRGYFLDSPEFQARIKAIVARGCLP